MKNKMNTVEIRKALALIVITTFIFGLMPKAFSIDTSSSVDAEVRDSVSIKDKNIDVSVKNDYGRLEQSCRNRCGDGICQKVVCAGPGLGCPCAETKESCQRDCDSTIRQLKCYGSSQVGDANEDGRITPADALLITQVYFGEIPKPANTCCLDVNKDMNITPADAQLAINYYFQRSPIGYAGKSCSSTATAPATTTAPGERGRVAAEWKVGVAGGLNSNLNKERLEKIEELDIRQLDKRQIERLSSLDIKNLDKIAELKKERLERISKLSEEKLERLSELEKEKLERVSDLNETEIEKAAVLNRARLKELTKLDEKRLKAELKAIKIVKVKNAEELDKRDISEARLAQLRENFEKAKDKLDKARDDMLFARKSLKDAREKRDEKGSLEHAKSYVVKTAEALISHLEKIKAKVQESGNVPEEREKAIVAEIDAQISEIAKIKADAGAAVTKEQVKEAAKSLQEKWKRLRHTAKLHAESIVSARVEGIVNRGIVLEKRLDKALAKAKENGIEVNVSAEISAFSDKIALAKDKQKQAEAKLSALLELKAGNATNEQVKSASDEAKALLKEARAAIKEAHEILKGIVKKIKEAKVELSADAEVEVAEEE